jgi:hypothetical protein
LVFTFLPVKIGAGVSLLPSALIHSNIVTHAELQLRGLCYDGRSELPNT